MRARAIAVLAALLCFAAAALLTLVLAAGASPRTAPCAAPVSERVECAGTVGVIVRGEGIASDGVRLQVPQDCTYGELFARIGADGTFGYDPQAPLSRRDVLLIDGEYILYIVV